jgi:hypothetical protein
MASAGVPRKAAASLVHSNRSKHQGRLPGYHALAKAQVRSQIAW